MPNNILWFLRNADNLEKSTTLCWWGDMYVYGRAYSRFSHRKIFSTFMKSFLNLWHFNFTALPSPHRRLNVVLMLLSPSAQTCRVYVSLMLRADWLVTAGICEPLPSSFLRWKTNAPFQQLRATTRAAKWETPFVLNELLIYFLFK